MSEENIKSLLPQFLLNSETYSLVIIDLEGKYIFVNEQFDKRFSFLKTQFIGQPSSIAIHPDDLEKCDIATKQCIVNPGKPFKVQVRKPDSNLSDFYWTEWEFSLFMDKNDEPIGILCLGHDITSNKRIEERSLIQSSVLDQILDFVTLTDLDGVITYVNKAEIESLRCDQNEIIGTPIVINLDDSEHKTMQEAIIEQTLKKGAWRGEIVRHTPDGDKQFLDCRTQLIYNKLQQPVFICLISTDITERKKSEQQLKLSEYKLKAIHNSTTDSNILISPDYTILSFNEATQKYTKMVFGRKIEENESMLNFLLPESKDLFMEDSQRALKGETINREINSNGFWFEITHNPVYDEQNNLLGFSMNSTYIDERKKATLKLAKQNKILRNIAWQQSHELRRPVANLLELCNMLKESVNEPDETKDMLLSYMLQSTQELDSIIHQIVDQTNESHLFDDDTTL